MRNLADVLAPYFNALHNAEKMRHATNLGEEACAREERLRQSALELTQAMEQERQRIGMDLHDQTLADLTRMLRTLTSQGPAPAPDELALQVSDCIDDLRRIIDTAVPTLLDLFGFTHALRIHLERAVDPNAVHAVINDNTGNLPDRLERTARMALFRIAQEAINNAARHSGATRLTVTLDTNPAGDLTLTVHDNGQGFRLPDTSLQSGLTNMQTRARLIAAQFDLFEDNGTCVSVCLPLDRHKTSPLMSEITA